MQRLTPDILLRAYAIGCFPMAEDRHDPTINWIEPHLRGVIPLDAFHVPKRLGRTLRGRRFELRVDTAFRAVIEACAAPQPDRPRTWLNDELIELYTALFRMGRAHSVETWRDDQLVGGLYGLRLGSAFFGESMFSRETDASKAALVELVARLRQGGFTLLDTQFLTEHLKQFGAIEVTRARYLDLLRLALRRAATFPVGPQPPPEGGAFSGADLSSGDSQSSTHTS